MSTTNALAIPALLVLVGLLAWLTVDSSRFRRRMGRTAETGQSPRQPHPTRTPRDWSEWAVATWDAWESGRLVMQETPGSVPHCPACHETSGLAMAECNATGGRSTRPPRGGSWPLLASAGAVSARRACQRTCVR